jgi:hypothetical protein
VSRRQRPAGAEPGARRPSGARACVRTLLVVTPSDAPRPSVDEDEPAGVDAAHVLAVGLALGADVGPVALLRPERLFFRGRPRRRSARHIAERLRLRERPARAR